ncbi:YhdP family protein [Thioalkalivibrio sulfidiphilus]|uniref:YhdP family protein n=1 Tax=Thioalkalivibrio sulfidiphilus TaxID=1033854 RepID=UPI003B2FB9E3
MSETPQPQEPESPRHDRAGGVRVAWRGWLSRLKTAAIWITASVLILLAVLVTSLRLVLPMASEYREQMAAELGGLLGHRVEIGALDARWRLLGPRILLDDVAIYGEDDTTPALHVAQVDVGVRAILSLWHRQLRVHSVRVLGADVHIHRDAEGGVQISGAGFAPAAGEAAPAAPGTRVLDLLAGTRFQLQSSRLRFSDEILTLDYRFDDLNLDVAVDADRLRLAGQVFLPRELGAAMAVGLDLRGDPGLRESWRGEFYVHGEGVIIEGLPEHALMRRVHADSGVLDLEVWGRLSAGEPDRLRARARARDLRFSPVSEEAPAHRFSELRTDLLWERRGRGWQLRLHDTRIEDGSPMGLSLAFAPRDEGRQVWGELEGVGLERLSVLLLAQPALLEEDQRHLLERLAPTGEIRKARFNVRLPVEEDAQPTGVMEGEFRELGVNPLDKIPGFHGLAGSFSLHEEGGDVTLASRGLRFEAPRLFADALWLDGLETRLKIERGADGLHLAADGIRVHNADIRAWGRAEVELGERPGMVLEMAFADGDGSRTAAYLPVGIMPQNTSRWLRESIKAGRVTEGTVVYRGPFTRLPFEEGEGEFEVRARVEEGLLDYQRGWPAIDALAGELIFTDRGMRAQSASGRLFGAQIQDATVVIEDYHNTVLQIQGQVDGPLQDMLRYVRESPLVRGLDDLLDHSRAQGDSHLDLSLRIPLTRREGGTANTTAQGTVILKGNRLTLTGHPVDFTDLEGQVRFTEATVNAEGVSANLHGEAVTLAARMPRGGPLTVDGEGLQRIESFRTVLPELLAPRLAGRARWQARLTAPLDGGATTLRLQSDLRGVSSNLPEPLAKPAARTLPITLTVPLTQAGAQPLALDLGQLLSMRLRTAAPGRAARGELRVNDGTARMPERGVRLAGRIEDLPLDDWLALRQRVPRTAGAQAAPEQLVDHLDVHVGALRSGDRLFRDLQIQAERTPQHWEARVVSDALRGQLDIPHDFTGAAPLTLNLELLDLDQLAAAREGSSAGQPARLDPRELPGIRGNVGALVLDGRFYRDVRIEATRIREGLQIHSLQLASARDHARMRITGDWRVSGADRHQTQLRFTIDSENVGEALTDLGFEHGFHRGTAKLEGQMRWPDAATRFTWQGLTGNVKLEVKDGRLTEVEPGAGRLLGLFSLNMIPRRLALDFRDLFQRGLAFDRMEGNIRFVDSDAYTSDLTIQSAAARVQIEGRTGIVARDYDQKITVMPRVGSTLPVAGAILGGPVAGVAVFVMDRLLGMGRRIDEASRVEYRITGSWDEPRVEVLARPVEEVQ